MNVQSGRSITAAGTGAASGAVLMVTGVLTEETGLAIIGVATLIVASMVTCLIVLLRQLADTTAERTALHEKEDSYLTAEATLTAERERLRRDLARGAQFVRETIERERKALRQEFEEERLALTSKAFKIGCRWAVNGSLDESDDLGATILRLPLFQPTETAARAASDD